MSIEQKLDRIIELLEQQQRPLHIETDAVMAQMEEPRDVGPAAIAALRKEMVRASMAAGNRFARELAIALPKAEK